MCNLEEMEDGALCRLVAQGNREAEEILVARYNRLVRSNSYTVGALDLSRSNPEDLMILQENFDEMWKRVQNQLSEFEAKILGFYLDGLSYQEIAVMVSKSPKSVDNAVQRIRRKVARQIIPSEISKR